MRRTVRTWQVGYIHPIGDGEAGFVVTLHRFVAWRWVLAWLCERLLPCGCCHDWLWPVGLGGRGEDGHPRYSLGRWWRHTWASLSSFDLPAAGEVQLPLTPEQAEQLSPGIVARTTRRAGRRQVGGGRDG